MPGAEIGRGRPLLSVGGKLALAAALILALASYLLLEHERTRSFAHREQAARTALDQLSLSLAAPLEFDDEIAIEEALATIADDPEVVFLEVTDVDRTNAVARIENGADVPPLFDGDSPIVVRDDATMWLRWPVLDAARHPLGTVVLGFSLAREHAEWTEQRDIILLVCGGFGAAFAFVLSATTRKLVLVPLSRLAEAADALGHGDLVAVPVESRDEVGRMAIAFNQMAQAIREREERLAAAHAEVGRLLDGMRQAIFTFGPDLKVVGRTSRATGRVFGRDDVAGLDARELLLSDVPDSSPEYHATDAFLDVAFTVEPAQWAELAALAPTELCLSPQTDREREITLEFVPLVDEGRLVRIMVLASDETEARRVKRDMQALQDRHASEIAAMRRLLGIGAHVFVDFEAVSRTRIDRVEALLAEDREAAAVIDELIRLVHGVRGDARALGLLELASNLDEVEEVLSPVRDAVRAGTTRPRGWRIATRTGMTESREALARARQRLVAASSLGEDVFDQVTVSARDLGQLAALRDGTRPEVRRCIDRLRARPFAEIATGLDEAVAAWASARGKRVRLDVEGATVRVDPAVANALRTAVVQLVRNAVAHGIEPPEVRRAAGKPNAGRIALRCADENGIVVEVSDDGAGVAVDELRLRAAAVSGGLRDDELPFVDGLSSRDHADDLAGRGVGLSAVRSELSSIGYTVALESAAGQGTRLRLAPRRAAA